MTELFRPQQALEDLIERRKMAEADAEMQRQAKDAALAKLARMQEPVTAEEMERAHPHDLISPKTLHQFNNVLAARAA